MKKAMALTIAALTTLAVVATSLTAPAYAGDRERRIAAGVIIGAIGGAIIAGEVHRNKERRRYHRDDYQPEVRHRNRGSRHRYEEPVYVERRYREPVYVQRRVREEPRLSRWERHVQACYNRYRTYDENSDTFIGRDGREYRCNL